MARAQWVTPGLSSLFPLLETSWLGCPPSTLSRECTVSHRAGDDRLQDAAQGAWEEQHAH